MKISIKEWLCIFLVFTLLFIISDPLLRYLYEIIPKFTLDDPNIFHFLLLLFSVLLLKFIIPGAIVYFGFMSYYKKKYKKKFAKV